MEHKPIRMTIHIGEQVLWSEPWAAGIIFYQKQMNGPWQFNWVGMSKEGAKQVLAYLIDAEAEFITSFDDMPFDAYIRY